MTLFSMYFLGYRANNLIYGCHCFGITCFLQVKRHLSLQLSWW